MLTKITLTTAIICCCAAALAQPDDIISKLNWTAQPGWLSSPAASESVSKTERGVLFRVEQPGKGMKWSAPLPQPVDLSKTPWVLVRYRAIDALPPVDYILWLGVEREQFVIKPNGITADGAWHTIIARTEPCTARDIAVQLQSGSPGAEMEISQIEFHAEQPKLTAEEVFAGGEQRPGRFQPIGISGICTTSPDQIIESMSLSNWLEPGEAVVAGIPFRIRDGDKSIATTGEAKRRNFHIPLSSARAAEIFVLAAVSSISGNQVSEVSEPHQFSAQVSYQGGSPTECVPARVSYGFGLSQGIAVYAVATDSTRSVRELVIRKNVPDAVLDIIGITLGLDTSIAKHARPVELTTPKPYIQAKPATADGLLKVSSEKGSVTVSSGATSIHLALQPFVSAEFKSSQSGIISTGSLWRIKLSDTELTSADFMGHITQSSNKEVSIAISDSRSLGMSGTLVISPDNSAGLRMSLKLSSEQSRRAQVFFPTLQEVTHSSGVDLSYCFPCRGAVVRSMPIDLRAPYSGLMPLQFTDICTSDGGLCLLTQDTQNTYKYFLLSKNVEGVMSAGVEYLEQEITSGAGFSSVPTVIVYHPGDWHTALGIYRNWLATWYKPAAPRKEWFRQVFNFRQQFLRFYIPGGERYYDKQAQTYSFADGIAADEKEFGRIDYLHLFDWGASTKWGRTGDYEPWDEIGGVDAFRSAVDGTQKSGIPVGLYLEGYLIDPPSRIAQAHGKEWEILDKDGNTIQVFKPAMHMCSSVTGWQDYLSAVYSRVREQTGAKGYYCDQMGFADPAHACFAPNHGHPIPDNSLRGQCELLQKIRKSIGSESVLYTEETPCDYNTQFQDGSFTYNITFTPDTWSPSHINLNRFALPDFKTFEIINCDHPLADRLTSVRQIFFNGEGIWLEGPTYWFAPEMRTFIRKMHSVMISYADCFTTLSPVPLVPTGNKMLFANQFPGESRTLWTLFNANYSTIQGEVLAIPHTSGARYFDAWNNTQLTPRIQDGIAYLSLSIGPRDVGCVVQEVK